ncbi:copper chaperone PCu(A)C [Hydrogenophaga atypica]|uniref:Copper chaperone PCu(A)C n=1 Tax=Hydrogenophaga atypica TaxID=249409 RepID=A0ABW2QQA4_9BURK
MKKRIITGLLAITVTAWAQTAVKVDDAWVRGTVATQKATGAFMRLTPSTNARLVEAKSPVAGVVEIHEMVLEKDIMKMRQIPGLDLAAGRTMELKPGGYHVMLMDLKQPLKGGEQVPITLVFEDDLKKRFTQDIKAPVTALGGGNAPMPMKPGMDHKH